MKIPCYMHYDETDGSVRLVHARTGVLVMAIKLEAGATGTMERLDPKGNSDADNYWLGVKPSDGVVFDREEPLFGRKRLVVDKIDFKLVK